MNIKMTKKYIKQILKAHFVPLPIEQQILTSIERAYQDLYFDVRTKSVAQQKVVQNGP